MSGTAEHAAAVTHPDKLQITVEASRRGYRAFAPVYDFVFGLSLQHGRRLAIDALDCRRGERILEVCVGSGLALPLYPKNVRVTGVDISQEMLDKAAQRITKFGLKQTEALLKMDAEHMSFADATFDKAIVLFGIAGLPDPVRAMNEITRVCRPGARIVIANHFRSRRPLLRLFDYLLAPIYRLLRYRADLDMEAFVSASKNVEIVDVRPANLFGYSTVLVCAKRPDAPRQ
jgi:phosphatidylethanolamine/phosphatidyl-N-methylethanolamine N-methyltransferase